MKLFRRPRHHPVRPVLRLRQSHQHLLRAPKHPPHPQLRPRPRPHPHLAPAKAQARVPPPDRNWTGSRNGFPKGREHGSRAIRGGTREGTLIRSCTRVRTCGRGTRSRAEPPSGVRRPCPVQRLEWPMRSGASGVARPDAFPHLWRGRDALPRGAAVRRPTAVSRPAPWMADALRRVRRCTSRPAICVLHSALSIIAPSVNVLRRTRRKPSTIRDAAPDVVIGQSTADRAGARPYRRNSGSPPCRVHPGARRRASPTRSFF